MGESIWRSGTIRWVRVGLALLMVVVVLPLPRASAQGGDHPTPPTWDDAPLVPRYRSQADWLVDVGWKTASEVYGPFVTHEYTVGEQEQFIPLGGFAMSDRQFVLRYRTEHAYFWFEPDQPIDPARLEAAANFFEDHIWPLNHTIYGDEWNPGMDGDSRLHIVNQSYIDPGIMGAFNPRDQCPRFLCPESNEREIIYISLELAPLGSNEYLTTLAHEHQHLIQHHIDGNEARWLNEGLSQLAEHFNGFHPRFVGGDNMREFLRAPDLHLNGWSFDGFDVASYYGAGYLFMVYLYERFGLDYISQLASSDYDGLAAVEHTLVETGQGVTVDQVFADWILANYLDDPYVDQGQYYYQTLDLPTHIQPVWLDAALSSVQYTDTLNQYGADYIGLDQPGTYEISFDGSDQVYVMGATPHSGDWMWWSYNNNNSAARLTGAFDLTNLPSATLAFSAWWNVEADYDWFQVLVSDNGGQRWEIVSGDRAQVNGPKAPGAYYSGRFTHWITEQIDLSAYVGRPVLIRFEYITDGSADMPGVVLDDIGIVEMGYSDNAESPESVWNPEGFMRIPATVPQQWTVAVVQQDGEHPAAVERVSLDALNTGRTQITVPDGGTATIVIGAMAPFTSSPANYKLTVRPAAP